MPAETERNCACHLHSGSDDSNANSQSGTASEKTSDNDTESESKGSTDRATKRENRVGSGSAMGRASESLTARYSGNDHESDSGKETDSASISGRVSAGSSGNNDDCTPSESACSNPHK